MDRARVFVIANVLEESSVCLQLAILFLKDRLFQGSRILKAVTVLSESD